MLRRSGKRKQSAKLCRGCAEAAGKKGHGQRLGSRKKNGSRRVEILPFLWGFDTVVSFILLKGQCMYFSIYVCFRGRLTNLIIAKLRWSQVLDR